MAESVIFEAVVNKVTTLADSGIRIAFDLPEGAIIEAAWLMQCKRDGIVLHITCEPCVTGPDQGHGKKFDELSEGYKRESERTATESKTAYRSTSNRIKPKGRT